MERKHDSELESREWGLAEVLKETAGLLPLLVEATEKGQWRIAGHLGRTMVEALSLAWWAVHPDFELPPGTNEFTLRSRQMDLAVESHAFRSIRPLLAKARHAGNTFSHLNKPQKGRPSRRTARRAAQLARALFILFGRTSQASVPRDVFSQLARVELVLCDPNLPPGIWRLDRRDSRKQLHAGLPSVAAGPISVRVRGGQRLRPDLFLRRVWAEDLLDAGGGPTLRLRLRAETHYELDELQRRVLSEADDVNRLLMSSARPSAIQVWVEGEGDWTSRGSPGCSEPDLLDRTRRAVELVLDLDSTPRESEPSARILFLVDGGIPPGAPSDRGSSSGKHPLLRLLAWLRPWFGRAPLLSTPRRTDDDGFDIDLELSWPAADRLEDELAHRAPGEGANTERAIESLIRDYQTLVQMEDFTFVDLAHLVEEVLRHPQPPQEPRHG